MGPLTESESYRNRKYRIVQRWVSAMRTYRYFGYLGARKINQIGYPTFDHAREHIYRLIDKEASEEK